jgi:fumarate reductase subunit D
MIRVSSSLTIILKIFFPLFWIIFFTCFAIGALFSNDLPLLSMTSFKIGSVVFLLIGILFFWLTTTRLQRVEMGKEDFYVTNYFKHYKYTYDSIEKISQTNWLLFKTIHIKLKKKGSLGKRITFLESSKRFQHFLEENPSLFEGLYD